MELRHIRYFVAVAEAGAFSGAAARLSITQPALWRQVHDLEAELGIRLFERAGRRVRLTGEGEALLGRSREVLAAIQRLAEHASGVRKAEIGSLRIGATPQMIQTVLASYLARYLKRRPGIDIHLVEEGAVRAVGLVERGEVHLALAVRRAGDWLAGRPLFPTRVLAALPPGHRLARRATIDVTDLRDERILLLRQGFSTRETFDGACRLAHVHPRIVLEAGDPRSLVALAETGRGVGIVPSTFRVGGRRVRVVPILQGGASLGVWAWIVWDPRRFLPAYARSFIDGLVQFTRRDYPGRDLDRRAPPVPRPRE